MEVTILNAEGVMRGISAGNEQSYVAVGSDKHGNQYHIIFACKMNYTDSVEKGLGRLVPIKNATSDISATMNTLGEVVDD